MFGKKKKEEVKRVSFEDRRPKQTYEISEEENEEDFYEEEEIEPINQQMSQPQQEVINPNYVPRAKPLIKREDIWIVKEVPLQVEKVLYNSKTGKAYDLYSAIALILNKTEE